VDHGFGGGGHLGMCDAAEDGGVARGIALLQHNKVQAGEDGALPADYSGGGFAPADEGLRVDLGFFAKYGGPDEGGVVIYEGAFGGASQERWGLQNLAGAFRVLSVVYDADAGAPGSAVGFQNCREG
jgi:hypothetical protein